MREYAELAKRLSDVERVAGDAQAIEDSAFGGANRRCRLYQFIARKREQDPFGHSAQKVARPTYALQ